MGTRADFYVGRGPESEWLGSVAYDGDPGSNAEEPMLAAVEEAAYRQHVAAFLASRDDATLPEQGWPWPWEDSRTTDCAYAFVASDILQGAGKVMASVFGCQWFDALDFPETDEEWEARDALPKMGASAFPDMTDRKAVTFGKRSGVIVIGGAG